MEDIWQCSASSEHSMSWRPGSQRWSQPMASWEREQVCLPWWPCWFKYICVARVMWNDNYYYTSLFEWWCILPPLTLNRLVLLTPGEQSRAGVIESTACFIDEATTVGRLRTRTQVPGSSFGSSCCLRGEMLVGRGQPRLTFVGLAPSSSSSHLWLPLPAAPGCGRAYASRHTGPCRSPGGAGPDCHPPSPALARDRSIHVPASLSFHYYFPQGELLGFLKEVLFQGKCSVPTHGKPEPPATKRRHLERCGEMQTTFVSPS